MAFLPHADGKKKPAASRVQRRGSCFVPPPQSSRTPVRPASWL